ncbi:MAG: ASCH domain-containing protein [Microcoleus sp.]
MCIQTRIQKILAEKEALDAKIVRLEKLESATAPVKILLTELLADYAVEAPEDLVAVWEEFLAIGQKHNLSVPLAADELLQWESDRADNEKSELAVKNLRSQESRGPESSPPYKGFHLAIEALDKMGGAKALSVGDQVEATNGGLSVQLIKTNQNSFVFSIENVIEKSEASPDSIPALTLWQPWASLIAEEVKRVETRSWLTDYRGPIAIHAAKRNINPGDFTHLRNLLPDEDIWTPRGNCEFPLGVVVAIANLIDCVEITPEFIAQQSEQELKCGDWTPGRFAWVLEIIRTVVPPIEASGGQKIWKWTGTSIAAELEHLEKSKASPEPKPESEEVVDLIESVLISHGFSQPHLKLCHLFDSADKYVRYQNWDIYYELYEEAVTAIGLYDENLELWSADTEMIGDDDPTFPKSLLDYDAIVEWTRKVIDEVVAITPTEDTEVPGQLSFDFQESEDSWKSVLEANHFTSSRIVISGEPVETYRGWRIFLYESLVADLFHPNKGTFSTDFSWERDPEIINPLGWLKKIINQVEDFCPGQLSLTLETTTLETKKIEKFEAMGFNVQVHPQLPLGVTFRFLDANDQVVFANSLTIAELGGIDYKTRAWDLIGKYKNKEAFRLEKLANPYAKEEDKFVELVKLTPAVGYFKRKDNGELLAAYAAFANRDSAGQKVLTFAKVRAKKWAEYLRSTYESCGWKVEEPRKIARMEAEPGAKQQFSYEIKITGFSIGQLQKLAEEDFSLLPNEIKSVPIEVLPTPTVARIYSVIVNSYELAKGTEEEMRSRFEEELKIFGGSQMSVSLLSGSQTVESYKVNDFKFEKIEDFDFDNPEYRVTHCPSQLKFSVWSRAAISPLPATWVNDASEITPGSGYSKREAAAVDAVRRLLLKGEKSDW